MANSRAQLRSILIRTIKGNWANIVSIRPLGNVVDVVVVVVAAVLLMTVVVVALVVGVVISRNVVGGAVDHNGGVSEWWENY